MVANATRWTVRDLDVMPDDWGWTRYEIVDGELFVTRAPHIRHQRAGGKIHVKLSNWSEKNNLGEAFETPGLVFTESDAVIPDVIWASKERIENGVDEAGHFTVAPELVVEVLSAGSKNEQRDREVKLRIYSLYGVQEYWIANWRLKTLEVYRRQNAHLKIVETLTVGDQLTSPILPDFECAISDILL
ncbi:MAG: Uma2 family endonuclease [Cyanobacteria bacterium P01_D01_bin.36]